MWYSYKINLLRSIYLLSSIDKNIITVDNSRESGYKSTNAYYDKNDGEIAKKFKEPINYGNIFVLSIPVGSFIGYLLLRNKRIKRKEDEQNENCKLARNNPFINTYLIPFIGGLFGAFTFSISYGYFKELGYSTV